MSRLEKNIRFTGKVILDGKVSGIGLNKIIIPISKKVNTIIPMIIEIKERADSDKIITQDNIKKINTSMSNLNIKIKEDSEQISDDIKILSSNQITINGKIDDYISSQSDNEEITILKNQVIENEKVIKNLVDHGIENEKIIKNLVDQGIENGKLSLENSSLKNQADENKKNIMEILKIISKTD